MKIFNDIIDSVDKLISPNEEFFKNLQPVSKFNKSSISNLIDTIDNTISANYELKYLSDNQHQEVEIVEKKEINLTSTLQKDNQNINRIEESKEYNKNESQIIEVFDKSKELINKGNISNIIDSSNQMVSKHKEKFVDVKNKSLEQVIDSLSNGKDSISIKVEKYVKDLRKITPVINKLGYEINEIEVELAIVPKIIPHFHRHTIIKVEIQEKIVNYCKQHGIPTLILSTLIEASKIQNTMNLGNLIFTDIEIGLGLVPSVKIKFTQQKEKK